MKVTTGTYSLAEFQKQKNYSREMSERDELLMKGQNAIKVVDNFENSHRSEEDVSGNVDVFSLTTDRTSLTSAPLDTFKDREVFIKKTIDTPTGTMTRELTKENLRQIRNTSDRTERAFYNFYGFTNENGLPQYIRQNDFYYQDMNVPEQHDLIKVTYNPNGTVTIIQEYEDKS
jgi:hypothetical protein